uniref:Uncharacterized protein n=1 Tax=Anopheles darlingi TaxID=43151 RepID=A0A2M4D9U9_ANODA
MAAREVLNSFLSLPSNLASAAAAATFASADISLRFGGTYTSLGAGFDDDEGAGVVELSFRPGPAPPNLSFASAFFLAKKFLILLGAIVERYRWCY